MISKWPTTQAAGKQHFSLSLLGRKVWRGTLARMRYKRTKAALAIIRYYRHYKVKSYVHEVARRFHGVKTMRDHGKHVKWPTPPKVLRRFEEALQAIFNR